MTSAINECIPSVAINIVSVTYRAGSASPAHSHPCPVVNYVLENAMRTQVRGAGHGHL
jgi:quercetin dioxygenase-like cupin family protein